jgi:hypothetical protein
MRKISTAILLGLFISVAFSADTLIVSFNTSNNKYHYTSCRWAKRCTVNCVDIPLEKAIRRGGIPCKVCHPPTHAN